MKQYKEKDIQKLKERFLNDTIIDSYNNRIMNIYI
jgi:Ulp1 family protease